MFGSFLPSLGCLAAIKSTQVEGADIVMKSSRVRSRRGLHLRQSRQARNATLLAECCDGRSHPASSTSSRNPKACRVAYVPPHIRNAGQQRGCRCCDHSGADESCEREYHDGQVCPSRDTYEARSPISLGASDSVPKRSHAVDGNGCN